MSERVPALDGIRGIAILSVVIGHITGEFPPPLHWPANRIYGILWWGWPGVDSFFILSGFLITGILLDARGTGPKYFTSFYARRVLRIFPVYYLFLLWLLVLRRTPIPSGTGIYYWTYTTNVMLLRGKSAIAETGPLWSLSVEEQFYLVWPALIALTPRRHFRAVCIALITLSLTGAFVFTLYGNINAQRLITRMDELAGGGLVASLLRDPTSRAPSMRLWFAAATVYVICLILGFKYVDRQMWLLADTRAGALLTAITIFMVARNASGTLARFLTWRPLMSWGLYSYAIYIMHMSIVLPTCAWLRTHWPPSFPHGLTLMLTAITCTLALCWLAGWTSYHALERPILSLKRFVPMPAR